MAERIKKLAEDITGIGRPKPHQIAVKKCAPEKFLLQSDGKTPNNPALPLIRYRKCVAFDDDKFDPAAIFEVLFASHDWKRSWRDSMYPFLHFHTRTHEALGIAQGTVLAQFGGANGEEVELEAGDVVIIPAGVGHKRLRKSRDLLIVGAYPPGGRYDEPRPKDIAHDDAVAAIAKVPRPTTDPVYGTGDPLFSLWRARGN